MPTPPCLAPDHERVVDDLHLRDAQRVSVRSWLRIQQLDRDGRERRDEQESQGNEATTTDHAPPIDSTLAGLERNTSNGRGSPRK